LLALKKRWPWPPINAGYCQARNGQATQRSVLDALEARYPMLRGTIRDPVTQQRRPFLRLFAPDPCRRHHYEQLHRLFGPDERLRGLVMPVLVPLAGKHFVGEALVPWRAPFVVNDHLRGQVLRQGMK